MNLWFVSAYQKKLLYSKNISSRIQKNFIVKGIEMNYWQIKPMERTRKIWASNAEFDNTKGLSLSESSGLSFDSSDRQGRSLKISRRCPQGRVLATNILFCGHTSSWSSCAARRSAHCFSNAYWLLTANPLFLIREDMTTSRPYSPRIVSIGHAHLPSRQPYSAFPPTVQC